MASAKQVLMHNPSALNANDIGDVVHCLVAFEGAHVIVSIHVVAME